MDGQEILVYVLASTTSLFFVLFITMLGLLIGCVMRSTKKMERLTTYFNCSVEKSGKGGSGETTTMKKKASADAEEGNSYSDLEGAKNNYYVTESDEVCHRPIGETNVPLVLNKPELPPRQHNERNNHESQSQMIDEDSDEDVMADKLYAQYANIGSQNKLFSNSSHKNQINFCENEAVESHAMVYDTLPPPRPVNPVKETSAAPAPEVDRELKLIRANSERTKTNKGFRSTNTDSSSVRVKRKTTKALLQSDKGVLKETNIKL